MSKPTESSFFISSPLTVKHAALYQHLLSGAVGYEALASRISRQIKAAYAFRQIDQVSDLSRVLINIPIKEYQLIGQYYLIWCKCREAQYHIEALETIIEQTQTYKVQALSTRGTFEWCKGNNDAALYFYIEALKASPTVSEYINLSKAIAVLKGQEGFHRSALKDLENLITIIRHAEPVICFDVLNSYAIELGEAGRTQEARGVMKYVLASPFAFVYPECRETAEELRGANRSFVAVCGKPVSEPVTPPLKSEKAKTKPAGVLMFPHKLKQAPPPEKPDAVSPKELSEITEAEKRGLLLSLIHSASISEQEYNRLLVAAGLVKGGPAANEINLEDKALLEDIISLWCNLIEPEQFAAVMSALRDCKDDWRRNCIIDQMIAIAFQQTSSRAEFEHEWRLKVECRLPEK